MKITHKGTLSGERLWVGICSNCHSRAEAAESEMTIIWWDDDGTGESSFQKCPVCGEGDGRDGCFGMLFRPREWEQYA